MKIKCTATIGHKTICPVRMECKFYVDWLSNLTEPFQQIEIKKGKNMECFKENK